MAVCEIHLDMDQHQYHPGESITGTVICSVEERHTVEEIQVCLKGLEETRWQEHGAGYRDNNTFLKLERIWTEEETNAIGWDVTSTKLKYPFKFDLPQYLAGSYQGKYGWVKYVVTAYAIVRGVEHIATEKETRIIAPIDFNKLSNLHLEPACYSEDKELWNWCFCSAFVSMDVCLNKEAFVLGELVNVKVRLRNKTTYDVNFKIRAKIWMIVESNKRVPHSQSKLEYALLTADSSEHRIFPDEQKKHEYNLQLPKSADLPNFALCKLFRQFCKLEVTAILENYFDKFKVEANLVVGHIPLGGQSQQLDMPRPSPVSNPIPYPPDIPQPAGSNSAPYPPDTLAPYPPLAMPVAKRNIYSLDDIKPVISYPLAAPAPYPPDKPERPYRAPYPREEHNREDPCPPTTPHRTYDESQRPAPYPPDKPSCPYPPSNSIAPYPPESPRSQRPHAPDRHTPPYPSYDKPTTEHNSSKSHHSVLSPVVMPKPYRPYQSNDSFTKHHYGSNPAPYPSVMPQPERANPPYPTSIPYPPAKLRASYPPSSNPTPYPSALSHSTPYPLDTSRPPYSTGFKPSYSYHNPPVPYPLGEANHPYPINNNHPIPPYPTSEAVPYPLPMPSRNRLPPRCDSIGFAVSTSATSSFELPDLPRRPETSAPHPSTYRPSAPSRESESPEDGATTPLLEGADITPPPSYEETISSPIQEQLKRK